MIWNTALLPTGSTFAALRKDAERQIGLDASPAFAAMTVTEHPDRWSVAVDVPGLSESEISITFQDGSLIIEGERRVQHPDGTRELFNDRSFGKFRRVLKVKEAIDRDRIEADLADGILSLTLHRSPEATPRKINIRGAVS